MAGSCTVLTWSTPVIPPRRSALYMHGRHGSRFTCYGEVINGPAKTGLADATHELADPMTPKKARVSEAAPAAGSASATAGGPAQ